MKNTFVISVVMSLLFSSLAQASPSITGEIKIASALKGKISSTAALYIIARHEGTSGGPPAAVKRISGPFQFPVSFSLSEADSMMSDAPFEGKFMVTARIAQSGAATPVNPGDIVSTKPPKAVIPGTGQVEIELNGLKK